MEDFEFDLVEEEFERVCEKVIVINNPIPDSVLWHQATNWRHAGELFRTNPAAWKKMKVKAQIPIDVIMEVEYAK